MGSGEVASVPDTSANKHPSLRTRMFAVLFGVSFAVMLAVTLAVGAVCFWVYEGDAEELLLSEARATAALIDRGTDNSQMAEQLSRIPFVDMRCTLIDESGEVLYDNWEDASSLGSHADREEVQAAQTQQQATVLRRSATLGSDALYAAILLGNGSVLRLSEVRTSLPSFLGGMSVPLAVSLVVIIVVSALVSRKLTDHIVRPLGEIDLACPTQNEAYRELAAQNVALEHANNMRREFTGNVSHEMKTPLQVIGGYAELMEAGVVPAQDVPRFAGLIRTEASSMRTLIDDVLTLSRLDEQGAGQGQEQGDPVDLAQVCRRVAERLTPRAQERGETIQLACRGSHTVRASASLAEQMVYNLVDNAVRYNREGGLVLVAVTSDDVNVELEVSDEGTGIPPELRERVFERFYRVDASRSRETGGTGLGLAIVKHAVETMGGTVSIDDSPCGGARFIVKLPVLKQE